MTATVELPELPELPAPETSGPELVPNAGAATRPRRAREAARKFLTVLRWLAGELTPPDIARLDPPCLAAVWRRARWGEQHPAESLLRAGTYAYTVLVAVPVATVAYLTTWAVERPSRAFVAALTVACTVVIIRAWL